MQKEKNIQDIYPLSPMQSGMLFHSLFSIEDTYLMQNVFELEGNVDPIALNDAWQLISNLHPILRTGFVWEKLKKPLQYTLESATVIFEEFNWQGLTTQYQEQKLKTFLQEDRRKGFNLAKAPLFRITLIKHDIDRYYLIWSQHHILLDGWCLPLILRDFLKVYQDLRQKKEVHLKTPRPYRDYIAWLQQQDMSQAELFWKEYLCHVEEPTYLSVKDNFKKTSANDYEIETIALTIDETDAIKKFAKQNNLTLNTVIQGAIGIVLKTYSQQQDVIFGITVSGRTIDLLGVEDMIGLFINTLPLRISYKPEDTPLCFLENLQALCQKLNEFAYPSLAQIQSWSPIDQSLFDLLFVFENYPLDENILPKDLDFTIKWLQGNDKTEYPLTIIVKPEKQFYFSFVYQTARFHEAFIKRFFEHLKQILQNLILNKEDPLQNTSVLTPTERKQLLCENGKIDHQAMATPNLTLRQLKIDYTPPQTPTEEQLVSIWSEVLQIDKIGIHDHFFKIGGHSLLATQIISRVRQYYNIDISIRALFDNPTIYALGNVVDSINKEINSSLIPPILPKQRQGPIPLSFAQQRLWFLDKLLPGMGIYNIPISLHLAGDLDRIALENAFNSLIQRHESLRTYFPIAEGKAYQETLPKLTIDILQSSTNLEHLEKKEQLSIVEELAQQEAVIPFDLSIGPLVRVKLLILAKNEQILLITFHHIISDGWSLKIFFKELSELYKAFSRGIEPFLPPLSIQYGDFTLWQKDFLQGKILEQQLGYWKQQLEGIPDLLVLPTDKPRPKDPSYKGASHQIFLSKKIMTSLNNLAQEQQSTLFMTLLAALQILLHRYSGQKDIVVGSPISNRSYKETENIIGLFINTLALRTQIENSYTFIDLLNHVRKTTLQAYQNQDVPFEQLVDYLKIARELNRNPVFQVMFTFQNSQEEATLTLEHLSVKPLNLSYPIAKFDLAFHIFEEKGEASLSIHYATDLFEIHIIERMANHFKELLQIIINNPQQTISTYSILNLQEQQQILIGWNNTRIDFSNQCIHELFEAAVTAYPHHPAVIFKEHTLTYQQLNHQANQLAHYLISIGIRPETLVAIFVERSLEMVIGILAILKAGGAYVPLDQNYPSERLQFILQDTRASFLLTNSFLKNSFGDYSGSVIAFDDQSIQKHPKTNPDSRTSSSHLAYVIYTSGSTGKPKGVQITHQSVVSFLTDMKERIGVVKEDILLSVTSMLFDIFGLELFLPLITGAKLIIAPQNTIKDGEALLNFLKQEHVTIMQATPTTWHMLLEAGWKPKENFKILHGGEALSQKLKESFQKMSVSCWNLYGPTETTIWSTIICINDCKQQNSSLIGRPIGNTQIYILDNDLNPVPIEVVGEIYIGGIGLARGYLKRSDLTAEKFIPNPFIQRDRSPNYQNLRLYRTGDLGRYLQDGNIEFFGRIDHQVKVRGFRIELGEIEAVLQSIPTVTQALAITREDIADKTQLVAYIVASTKDEKALIKSCLEYCESQLPNYMIPNQIVIMNQFPLNPNGKIDRKALPAPELANSAGFTPPRNQLDRELRRIWSKILGLAEKDIGIHHDFFSIGGDSIGSVQVIYHLKKTLGLSVSVKDIFNYTSIEKLSDYISYVSKNSTNHLNDFEPYIVFNKSAMGDHNRLFLFPPGNGGAESYLNNIAPKLLRKNLVLFNNLYLHQKNKSEDQLATMTYENLASDYITYIKSIQPQGPYHVFGWSFGGVLAFEVARQLMEKMDVVGNIILLDAFFNYKTAVLRTKTQTEEINFKYSPQIDRKVFSPNITLFKSSKICVSNIPSEEKISMHKIYKYYAEKTKYNHLDDLLEREKIKIKIMDHTHDSWIRDEMQILEICKELDF